MWHTCTNATYTSRTISLDAIGWFALSCPMSEPYCIHTTHCRTVLCRPSLSSSTVHYIVFFIPQRNRTFYFSDVFTLPCPLHGFLYKNISVGAEENRLDRFYFINKKIQSNLFWRWAYILTANRQFWNEKHPYFLSWVYSAFETLKERCSEESIHLLQYTALFTARFSIIGQENEGYEVVVSST